MSRSTRQTKILSLISCFDIDTQEELVDRLKNDGYEVTQATVSRDIKDLGLVKTLSTNGKYKYVTRQAVDNNISSRLLNVFRESVVSIVNAQNLLVIKTIGENASSVATTIKNYAFEEVLGVLSDKNTVLIVCADKENAEVLSDKINRLL